ncbi:chaperonin 10-like protein [Delphinella strobiligena]|nr:chaperonin 10-like protein [Delphinella strobiligena]
MMRAARYYGKEDIRIEEIPKVSECGPGQIRIEPAFVGICGTDLHEYIAGPNFSPLTPHPVTGESIPIGVGHEFSGTISEVGPGSSQFKVGQKVAIQPTIYCGSCGACRDGVENACANGGFIGLSGGGGGLSDELVVPSVAVHPLPDNITLDVGALVEPLSVGWHAVKASPLNEIGPENANVLVLGGGPIGLAVVQALVAQGTKKIIMSEVAASRQAFARVFKAHHVLDPRTYDLVAVSRELCGGNGPDIVFDCAGVAASLETACNALRSRGTVVNVAIWEKAIPFNPNMLVFKEGKYVAVLGYQRQDFEEVIQAIADGRLNPERMITSKIHMTDLVEKGILALVKEKDKHVKILIDVKAR